jgi:signal transduction histidine kinase
MISRPHLLLVDDEPVNLTLLKAYLDPLGYEMSLAENGRRALEVFDGARPDLVLLDVRMPDIDGIDALLHIRAEEGARGTHTPVILITGSVGHEDRVRGLEAGADEFLEKPVDRAVLIARVRTLLRLKEATDALVERNASLERMQQAQRELVQFIVHDLKSPLAAVSMNLVWARQQMVGVEQNLSEALGDAEQAASRLERLIEDLLSIARIEEAELVAHKRPVAIGALMAEIVRECRREVAERGVHVTALVDETLRIEADPELLRRVLHNLVENALRYTPTGGRVMLSAQGGAEPAIVVSNEGRPIPEGDRAQVFEKFGRGAAGRGAGRNVGLGLYFCKVAMAAQGGGIELARTPEWPVSFVLRLPGAEQEGR